MAVNGYQLLANAVIKKAVEDYRKALVGQHDVGGRIWNDKVNELERFFTSDLFNVYTKLDGSRLMKAVKEEVIEYNYDLKTLRKSHGNTKEEEEEDLE